MTPIGNIVLGVNPALSNAALNTLFTAAWDAHAETDFQPILSHSLLVIAAYADDRLVGFVNVAWDGGIHAFLLDTTVHPDYQRRGIGQQLVQAAIQEVRTRGIVWLHVDYESHLDSFYRACGFQPTTAGLINLKG